MDNTIRAQCNFGVGCKRWPSIAKRAFDFHITWNEISVHIVDDRQPHSAIHIRLILADIDILNMYYDNTLDYLLTCCPPAAEKWQEWKVMWFIVGILWCHVAIQKRNCRSFTAYLVPSHHIRLYKLLNRTKPGLVTCPTPMLLGKISEECSTWLMTQESPRRFKFSIKDDARFNLSIYIGSLTIHGEKCIHVVDSATRFQAAWIYIYIPSQKIW